MGEKNQEKTTDWKSAAPGEWAAPGGKTTD
jgi:hypothetical protein